MSTTTNPHNPPAAPPQANISVRRAPTRYFQVSQLPSPPHWADVGISTIKEQNYAFAHNQACGNVTSRPHPRIQFLEYAALAYDPDDLRGERRIRTLLCRDCAYAVRPDFVMEIEDVYRKVEEQREMLKRRQGGA